MEAVRKILFAAFQTAQPSRTPQPPGRLCHETLGNMQITSTPVEDRLYLNVRHMRNVFAGQRCSERVEAATLSFTRGAARGNPIVEYMPRLELPPGGGFWRPAEAGQKQRTTWISWVCSPS